MDKYTAHAEIDHANGSYKIGEPAVCTVMFYKNGNVFPCNVHSIVKLEDRSLVDQTFAFT